MTPSRIRLLPRREQIDQWLAAVRRATDLSELLEQGLIDPPCRILVLPSTLPVAMADSTRSVSAWVTWPEGSVVIADQDKSPHAITGTVRVNGEMRSTKPIDAHEPHPSPQCTTVTVRTRSELDALATKFMLDATNAEWQMVEALEPFVADAVHRKNARVGQELLGGDREVRPGGEGWIVIDRLIEEEITSQLLLGERGDHADASMVRRMIRRMASSATSSLGRADVATVICRAIDSAAETRVRSRIGDPHVGRLVRRFVRKRWPGLVGIPSAAEVLEQFNAANPQHQLGMKRLLASMSADHVAEVGALPFHDHYRHTAAAGESDDLGGTACALRRAEGAT